MTMVGCGCVCAGSGRWQMGDGELADVHTAHTIRAQELLDLYKALNTVGLGYVCDLGGLQDEA